MHEQTSSVFFHWKMIELPLCQIMPTTFPCNECFLYLIHHLLSCKKVVWNKIIILKCNLNKTSTLKRLAKHVSISLYVISGYISINMSMAVWFCQSCFSWKKGDVVAIQHTQPVRESNSFFHKRQIKTSLTNFVVEHAKSHIQSNAKTRPEFKSVPECALQ